MTKKTSAPVCMILWMAPPRAVLGVRTAWRRGGDVGGIGEEDHDDGADLFQPKAYETPMGDTVTTWWTCISQSLRLCSMRQETMPWA